MECLTNLFEYGSNEHGHWCKNKVTGLIEQWNKGNIGFPAGDNTVTLPISFSDKYYTIIVISGNMSANSNVSAQTLTPNTFSLKHDFTKMNKVYWYARGY